MTFTRQVRSTFDLGLVRTAVGGLELKTHPKHLPYCTLMFANVYVIDTQIVLTLRAQKSSLLRG